MAASTLQIVLNATSVSTGLASIKVELTAISTQASKTQNSLDGVGSSASRISDIFKAGAGLISGFLAVEGIIKFGEAIFNATSKVELMQAKLATLTGSAAKGGAVYAELTKLSNQWGMSTNDLADAFFTLKKAGLDTTAPALKAVVALARESGESTTQAAIGVMEAGEGMTRRLKMMGINAKQAGDSITFTFQGVSTKVKKNTTEIQKYLDGVALEKFGGLVDRAADTVSGAFQVMKNSATQAMAQLGEAMLSAAGGGAGVKKMADDFSTGFQKFLPLIIEVGKLLAEIGTGLNQVMGPVFQSIGQFLDSTSQVGGVTVTNLQLLQAAVKTLADNFAVLFTWMSQVVTNWATGIGKVVGWLTEMWNSNFLGIRDLTINVFNFVSNYVIHTITTIGLLIQQLPQMFTSAFSAASQTIQAFGQMLKDALSGNLHGIDWAKIGNQSGLTAAWKPLIDEQNKFSKDMKASADQMFSGTTPKVVGRVADLGNSIVGQINKNAVAIAKAQKKTPTVGGDPLVNDQMHGGDFSDDNSAKKAESEFKKWETRVKSLADSYAPLIGMQIKLKQGLADLAKLDASTDSYLQSIGIKRADIATMRAGLENELSKTFFSTTMSDLKQAQTDLSRGTDIMSVAMNNYDKAVKAAADAHQPFNEAQKETIKQEEILTETLKRQHAMDTYMGDRVQSMKDEIALLQVIGPAHDRLAATLQIEAQARKEGLSADDTAKRVADFQPYIDQLEKAQAINAGLNMDQSMRDKNMDIQKQIALLGQVGDQYERNSTLIDVQNEAIKAHIDPTKYVQEMKTYLDQLDAAKEKYNTFQVGASNAITTYMENARKIADITNSAITNVFDSLTDKLADFIKTGKFDMKGFLTDIASELAKFAAQQAVRGFLSLFLNASTGGTGGLLSGLFGGFRAGGGDVSPNQGYVVGEHEAEWFQPKTAGTIYNSAQLANMSRSSGSGTTRIEFGELRVKVDSNGNISDAAMASLQTGMEKTFSNLLYQELRPNGQLYNLVG